jgi:cohesin loading factor subunit SCC2
MESISSAQGRLSYALTVLNLPFCQQSDRVLKILLDSAGSEQSSVRTKGLKSVTQMLEQDPSLLDGPRNVKSLILRCASDASSKVRDSALTLIGKCILLKPALEQEFCMAVLGLSNDPAILVKKRAMRLLQDMYLRNSQKEVKAAIADSLLQRVKDHDTGVADLARQSLEEIWFSPYAKLVEATDLSVQDKISLQLQIGQIVGTAQRGESVSSTMVGLFQDILSNKSKMAATNFKICKALVAIAFEGMIDSGDLPGDLEQTHILQTLTVFARANAKLFAAEQLQYLQPYITNLSNPDDLNIFRSVVVVFRCVLPILSVVQHGFLRDVQTALLHSIAKLGRTEMDEVAACLWTINGTLKDPEKLIKLTVSVLKNLRALEGVEFSDPKHIQDLHRVRKYVRIAGYFGKHCDFEGHSKWFQQSLPWWKGKSVAGLIVGALTPFAKAQQPLSLRADALDAIGLICQSWPFQFNQETVSRMFEEILTSGEPELQKIVLSSFRDFFAKQERHAEGKGDIPAGGDNPENGKLGGSMTASDGDGASALIAQRFLRSVLQIALASQDQSALTATQVIASINRQGLVHPKESGPALVALETSTNKDIAEVAFQAHRSLHQQHESMFEREYMRAIQETFRYQRDIVKDAQGAIGQPPTSKLCALFEIIKTSKGKYQRKFLDNFCSKINFDAPKLEWDGGVCTTLQYSRFLIENLAFFDYGRMEELLHTVSCMERIVASTGSGIAHSISTDIFHVKVESLPEGRPDGAQRVDGRVETPSGDVSPQRLHQLAVCAIILLCVWDTRTYLRRLYGLQSSQQKRDSKTKASVKDLNRVPSRAQGVSGERLLRLIAERICSLDSTDGMVKECKELVELLSIDNELKVEAEDGEEVTQTETLSGDDAPETSTPARGGPRPQKRKGSLSVNGSPQKRKRERPTVGPRKRSGQIINNHEGERN